MHSTTQLYTIQTTLRLRLKNGHNYIILLLSHINIKHPAITAMTAAAVMTTTFAGFTASADDPAAVRDDSFTVTYNGHEVIRNMGFKDLDEIATFVSNVGDISHNHNPKQYIGWLRSYDPWYEGSAVKAEHIDGDKLSVSDAKEKRAA